MSFRIATFNLENLGKPGKRLDHSKHISSLRPQLERLDADILCLQEVFAQSSSDDGRKLEVLDQLFDGTQYAEYNIAHTHLEDAPDELRKRRNLIIASSQPISSVEQYNYDLIEEPTYRETMAEPPVESSGAGTDRPFLYARIQMENGEALHLINLHLKSRNPSKVEGRKEEIEVKKEENEEETDYTYYAWDSAAAWAEGYFMSSMKRVSQALETRVLVDKIFDENESPKIVVCGDFNAPPGEVPVEAIAGRVENTENPDLSSRVLVPCENTIPDSSRYTHLYYGEKRLLDHMLISRPLLGNYQEAEIHNEILHDETISFALDIKYPESDHAPFVGVFDFEE